MSRVSWHESLVKKVSQDWALFRLLGESLWPYKGWMLAALLLITVVATLNVVPPLLLQWAIDGPLAQAINNPEVSGFNGLLAEATESGLLGIAAFSALTAIGIYGITYAYTYFLQQAGQRALADLRVCLFNHLLNHDYTFLSKTSTGELVARLTNDID